MLHFNAIAKKLIYILIPRKFGIIV